MCAAFRTDEVATSQLPAMLLLAKMGWQPLTKAQANTARKTRQIRHTAKVPQIVLAPMGFS